MSRSALISSAFAALLLAAHPVLASAATGEPSIVQPDAFKWAPAEGLPPGAEVAVLYGDPAKAGPFAIRFKFPAGYEVPLHSHPTDEFITVISGKAGMSFGDNAEGGSAEPLPAGAFMTLPAGAWHRLWADRETVVELHSTGPFGVHLYTN